MITVAIVGAGIGREHLRGYMALPDRFRVAALCDLDTARARQVIAAETAGQGGIAATADMAAVLADPGIDLVDICLPPHLHFSAARDALRAGKHVVCEKPLVPSLAEADELARIAARAGRSLTPVFQYRYGPAMAAFEALEAAGLVGRPQVGALETHWDRGADYYAVSWRGTWAGENGGAILTHAIHNHDLLARLMGPIARVSAHLATRVNPIEVEDCAALGFVLQNGAVATSSITLGAAGNTSRLRIVYEHLTAESGSEPYAPMTGAWRFTARDPARQPQIDAVLAGVAPGPSGFAGFFAALADALAGRPGRQVTLDDGRRSIELVAAIYRAARSGRAVTLPLTETDPHYRGWAPHSGETR